MSNIYRVFDRNVSRWGWTGAGGKLRAEIFMFAVSFLTADDTLDAHVHRVSRNIHG